MPLNIPMVLDDKDGRGYDLFSRLLRDRIILLTGSINDDTAGIVRLELAAHSTLTFLLDRLVRAVLYQDEGYRDREQGFVPSSVDKKYLRILPAAYLQDYWAARTGDEGEDLYRRLLVVTDFLSGMTDSYARRLYREVSGIE